MRSLLRNGVAPALLAGLAGVASAQTTDSLVMRMAAMSAVSGLEDAMADSLVAALPGAVLDRAGNVVWARGSGDPVRIAICPMDEIGYVVGGVTPDGYLTLRRVGTTNAGPLYDQFLEGQRVTVFGRRGAVAGVVGVRSTHLTRGRTGGPDDPFNLDNAYVDVGAASAAEAGGLGIEVLAPVTRAKRPHRYGPSSQLVAAPFAGARARRSRHDHRRLHQTAPLRQRRRELRPDRPGRLGPRGQHRAAGRNLRPVRLGHRTPVVRRQRRRRHRVPAGHRLGASGTLRANAGRDGLAG